MSNEGMTLKKSTFFALLIAGILVISSITLAFATPSFKSIDRYLSDNSYDVSIYSDEQILFYVDENLKLMNFGEGETFSELKDGEIIAIARNTKEGRQILSSLDLAQQ